HYESVIIQHVDTACFQNVSTHNDEYTKRLIVFGQTLISVCLYSQKQQSIRVIASAAKRP
ncbi:MAG: hypothetical protein LBG80_12205, partial [Bacteroidales bacterium]|nr:hypothetical protein [Bacteroidales bacterium]